MTSNKRFTYRVVKFINLPPFEGIDEYVCVPLTWMVTRRGQIASIAYPHDENPSDTRNRAKNVEPHQDNWRCYLAEVTHETNSFEDAESWIASKVNVNRSNDNIGFGFGFGRNAG